VPVSKASDSCARSGVCARGTWSSSSYFRTAAQATLICLKAPALAHASPHDTPCRLAGACGSCPSSLTTMTMGIKRRLMERIPVREGESGFNAGVVGRSRAACLQWAVLEQLPLVLLRHQRQVRGRQAAVEARRRWRLCGGLQGIVWGGCMRESPCLAGKQGLLTDAARHVMPSWQLQGPVQSLVSTRRLRHRRGPRLCYVCMFHLRMP
jgi:hypothetical protein